MILSWALLFRKLKFETKRFVPFALKLLLATTALSVITLASLSFYNNLEIGVLTKMMFTLISSMLGLLVFVIVGTLLGISEFQSVHKLVKARIGGGT